ncbi:f-box-like domain-containing protein [Hirsutella rhossiliensis]|uniref:F-box-like domain-containing protein n=1 Tax=Hirsutella rhossiliensis TaxID=111463 RepID=A0A9P8MMF6_9HYPO|nr:f-box-like domain-containing protein [Hirsutella rhossiliensis]KAH0957835.1 f-box-like domain-containing protein [Hirsutella rhossiliensis]
MVSQGRVPGWDELPDEILLQIVRYLEPCHITNLQLVSRKLRKFCLDDGLWKRLCLGDSPWYRSLQSRRGLSGAPLESADGPRHATLLLDPGSANIHESELQDMANWDPTYPGEQVSWYDEYMQRNGPVCVNWLQTPRIHNGERDAMAEARGLALYSPRDGLGTMLAVSPLDDGSVCLWDVRGTRGKRGGIVARSKLGMLTLDGPGSQKGQRSAKVDTGVIECVSVNNSDHRALFAVKSHLVEVDLRRLDVVSRESFEWSITTLSAVHEGVPLTVGTSLGIHLHDFRARARVPHEAIERLDGPQRGNADVLKAIFDPKPLPPYAALSQPTPISILHLPRLGSPDLVSDDIYVAGRFTNILHYDRRKFPSIAGTIHSGAQIKSLASLPFSFSPLDTELRQTLIAGGGYNTKGSLEIYGLSTATESASHGMLHNSAMKNRQTAASATILSVINHGTKIVFSDGAGLLKWFERDGSTECRRVKIGHSDAEELDSLFASMPGTDDLARKMVSTQPREGQERSNDDNILFWTGEKLGMVADSEEATEDAERKRAYKDRMRKALAWQADEVRFMGTLGMGMGMGAG